MTKQDGISVALATCNGAGFIREQLDSVAQQTLTPTELVVCDDRSSDDTITVVRAFSRTAPFPVRIEVNAERLGFADNFLKAASLCRASHVAFCDQDDVWLPEKLAVGMRRLVEDGATLSLHRSTMTDVNLKPFDMLTQGIMADAAFEPFQLDPYINGWGNTMLFARSLLDQVPAAWRPRQPEDLSRPLSHDTWIYTLAAALGRTSHITTPLLLYRQHGRNAQGAVRQTWPQRLNAALTVPIGRFAARRDFAFAMMEILERFPNDSQKSKAAKIYRLRGEAQAERLAGYTGKSLPDQIGAFRRYHELVAHDPAHKQSAASRLKDLVLGVGKLGRVSR